MIRFLLACACLVLIATQGKGQLHTPSIYQYEDSLEHLGLTITNDSLAANRVRANYTFIKTLVNALKENHSFSYPFKKLESTISMKTSEDKKFRLFTWFVLQENGTFRYYGALQLNTPGQLQLIPLIDNTANIANLQESETLLPQEWLGAVYYDIIPVSGKNPYYMLLGWKGMSLESTHKVIEILTFKDNKASFGLPVLESGAGTNTYVHRKLFAYSSHASMLLKYSKDQKIFVFDHLVPTDENTKDHPELYAPDLSYDAYKYKNGKWSYQENAKLKNAPDKTDDIFFDPAKVNPNAAPIRQY